jgi:hypothetical protein
VSEPKNPRHVMRIDELIDCHSSSHEPSLRRLADDSRIVTGFPSGPSASLPA